MENYIFIIFAIILFAFKQYQKSQKKKMSPIAASSAKETQESPITGIKNIDEGLNEFIQDFFGEKQNMVIEDDLPEVVDLDEENSINTIFEESNKKQEVEVNIPYSIENDDTINLEERYNGQFGINKNKENNYMEIIDFDLKKAVIYDAVLNPPYIIN